MAEVVGVRTVTNLMVANVGEVRSSPEVTGVMLVDGNGTEVVQVSQYLQTLLAGGASKASARSYAIALLRWWRFLAAVDVQWVRASQANVRDFVLWMRFTAKPSKTNVDKPETAARGRRPVSMSGTGYAPATINHNLAVLRSFYEDRIAAGCGLERNQVPEAVGRGGDWPHAHQQPNAPGGGPPPGRPAPEGAGPAPSRSGGRVVRRPVRRDDLGPGPGPACFLCQHRGPGQPPAEPARNLHRSHLAAALAGKRRQWSRTRLGREDLWA